MSATRSAAAPALAVGWLLILGAAGEARALPRMSLTAGSPCATCHVSPQGGGARTEIGWGNQLLTRALPFASVGLPSLDEAESNTLAGGKVMLGLDLRSQLARMGSPQPDPAAKPGDGLFSGFTRAKKPDYMLIPMQFQPYLTVLPLEWLTATGSFNISTTAGSQYPGQSAWEAQLIVHGDAALPQLRIGMIQPTLGVRHDDHTILLRADAMEPRRPIVPAGYAELGGELSWQPRSWLRAEAGAFLDRNIRAASAARAADPVRASGDGLAWSARLSLLPQLLDQGVNTWVGGSAFGAGEFTLLNAFVGAGKSEWGAVQLEVARGLGAGGFRSTAWMALASWTPREWIAVEGRAELATTEATLPTGAQTSEVRQFVFGLQFFPLPYVEIRPEYRLRFSEHRATAQREAILGQYALQLHLFY
jgi:hypothetical protein